MCSLKEDDMPNKGAIPVIILIVIIFISLSLAGGAYYLFQQEKKKNMSLQEELEEVRTKEKIIETKLDDKTKAVSQLEVQLRESKGQVDFFTAELDREKKTNQDTQAQLAQVKLDLDKQRKSKQDIEQKLTDNQQEVKKLQAQLKGAEDKKTELEVKIRQLEEVASSEKVELGTIVVGQPEPAAAALPAKASKMKAPATSTALEGKVLVVNKDYNFAVINLGSKDGVKINDTFAIYNKNKYVGDIKIEKVHDSMAAANFVTPDLKEKVREGDKVVLKK
jgi:glucan-binding YG repeat protein